MAEDRDNARLKTLAQNIKKDPDDSFSKFALALEFNKRDQYDKARVLFESIRNNDPEYVGVYYHLGKTYELLGLNQQAQITYTEGIEIASSNNAKERTVSELKEALAELNMELRND
ncbi:hypothetical protein ACG2F4_00980 [Halalkalibaculum sp. DA3122]|uniref:hypothetical protein n=1 Tax=unclassified Halalkalibaculum TaxID=2964617 RepID=UPI003754B125